MKIFQKIKSNQDWYLICPSEKVKKDKPFSFNLNGIPLVLFRNQDDELGVLLDRCPHRNIPMSNGYMENGLLVCRFHGWHFDVDGVCRKVTQIKECDFEVCESRNAYRFEAIEQNSNIWVYCTNQKSDFPDIDRRPSEYRAPMPTFLDDNFFRFTTKLLIFFVIVGILLYIWFTILPQLMQQIINL